MPTIANELDELEKRLVSATGADREIDRRVAMNLDERAGRRSVPDYTGSVDICIELIRRLLPDWHWHVGHGPTGVLPYAALTREERPGEMLALRVEAMSPTVPLALLTALVRAMRRSEFE